MTTSAPKKPSHFFGLDLLRFFAAVLVVLFHHGGYGSIEPEHKAAGFEVAFPGLKSIGWPGWVGVEIFFVLSGFVIAASAQGAPPGQFLRRRFIRVMPTLWVCSLLSFAIRFAWAEPLGMLVESFLKSIFLSPKGPYIDGVVWTLVVEAAFYLFIAGLIWVTPGRDGTAKQLDWGAVLLGSVSTLFLTFHALALGMGWSFRGTPVTELLDWFPLKVVMFRHGVFFALGMLLWSMHRNGRSAYKAGLAGVFAAMSMVEIFIKTDEGLWGAVPGAIWAVCVAGMVASVRWNVRLFPAGGKEWIRQLGLMTYPLYLNHFTFGMYLVPALAPFIPSPPLLLAVTLTAVLTTAWMITRWPERMLQDALRRALAPAATPARAMPAAESAPR